MKTDIDRQVDELEYQLQELKQRVADLRRQRPHEEVKDYTFRDAAGHEVTLSSLFGDKGELILVHNMGRDCAYCTMWADGFAGVLPHLTSRAAFVVTSPDEPLAQEEIRRSRGWDFPLYSTKGTDFIAEMGFDDEKEGLMPGVSVFTKDGEGQLHRVARAEFGPGDNFCAVWHLFELLPRGVDGWEPKRSYELVNLARTS